MKNPNILAIIPARGGSKRIPGKNSKNFLGVPILSYSVKAAVESNLFDKVMVSTDDSKIAEIARSSGAEVPFLRSSKTSDHFATVSDVLLEVLHEYENLGIKYKYLCCIYPTAPFITSNKLRDSYEVMLKTDSKTVLSVVKFGYPIQRALIVGENRRLELIQPDHSSTRSQDLQPTYHDAGQFFWLDVEAFKSGHEIFNEAVEPYILSKLEVQDIDTEEDWQLAEMKYELKQDNHH